MTDENLSEPEPLLSYSDTLERATLIDTDYQTSSMPAKKKRSNKKSGVGRKKKRVRVNKGRLNLKVAGYKGFQSLTASELIHHIPLAKLRAAAKKVLKRHGRPKRKTKKRKSRK
jgi:hypothetical protein